MKGIPFGVECANYQWIAYSHSECSAVCSRGFQSSLYVRNGWSHQERSLQMHTACIVTRIDFKPATRRGCDSYCEYSAGPWSDYSVTCGYGRKTKEGICLKGMSKARSRQWQLLL